MNSKQLNFPNILKPVKNSEDRKNESIKSLDLSAFFAGKDKEAGNHLMLRLQEMEELNTHLEKLVEQRTKKLAEVIATNTKFLSVLAHDLRSPFSSIIGILGMLKARLKDNNNNEIEKYVNLAYKSANNTLNLIDNLLVWIVSQNKERSFNPVKINLHALLSDEVKNFSSSASQKQITISHSIPPRLNVIADLQMVKIVLRNLISNAIKYTNTEGEISISASESKQFVEIGIKDNGIGISINVQRNLFKTDVFHSTEGTNNEKGTGLGLLLCKEFVEIHGGSIRIESQPGKGSEFKFTLPHYI